MHLKSNIYYMHFAPTLEVPNLRVVLSAIASYERGLPFRFHACLFDFTWGAQISYILFKFDSPFLFNVLSYGITSSYIYLGRLAKSSYLF